MPFRRVTSLDGGGRSRRAITMRERASVAMLAATVVAAAVGLGGHAVAVRIDSATTARPVPPPDDGRQGLVLRDAGEWRIRRGERAFVCRESDAVCDGCVTCTCVPMMQLLPGSSL
jgi:hypothetical protein